MKKPLLLVRTPSGSFLCDRLWLESHEAPFGPTVECRRGAKAWSLGEPMPGIRVEVVWDMEEVEGEP